MSRVVGIIETLKLMRLGNCLIAAAGVLVGGLMTGATQQYYGVLVTSLAVALVCAAGNVFNDVVDLEADRINHPRRPLVRASLSRTRAIRWVWLFNGLALAAALTVNWYVTLATAAGIGLLMAYNLRLKGILLAGNLTVAILGGSTLLMGGLAIDRSLAFSLPGPLIGAVYAFLFHLVRELVKDAEDIEGDRAVGEQSLPQALGVQRTMAVALILFVLLIVMMMIPVMAGWFSVWYRGIAIYMVGLPMLALLIFVWGDPSRRMLRVGTVALKLGMVLGLVALVLA